jgi:hypothetical protein
MFQYAIDMDVSKPFAIADGAASIPCLFRHFNRAPIVFDDADGRSALSLGYRLYTARARTLVHEGRGRPKAGTAKPEQWLPFELEVPGGLLSGDEEFEILVDLVADDEVWFHERGHHGNRFRLNFIDQDGRALRSVAEPVALGEIKSAPAQAAQGASLADQVGAGFMEMLAVHDFSDYGAIARSNRADPQPPSRPPPPELMARFNRQKPVSHDGKLALTALMEYFLRQHREDVDRLVGKRSGRFALVRRFFETAHQLSGETADYFPPDIVEELNAFALADGVFELPLSRLMLWHWMAENRPLSPDMAADRESIFWWWATGAMPANRVPDVFLPEAVKAHLSGPHESFRGRTVELSRFAFRAYAESEQLRQRYDLKTTAGLIGYSFDFLIHNAGNRINRHFIGSAARAWWRAPVLIHGVAFSRFEVALAAQSADLRPLASGAATAEVARAARARLDARLRIAAPEWLPFSPAGDQPDPAAGGGEIVLPAAAALKTRCGRARDAAQPTLVVAGLLGSASGLGVNLRMTCQTLQAAGAGCAIYDVTRRRMAGPEPGSADPALLHVNADMVGEALAMDPTGQLGRRRRIGFFLWELDVLPPTHLFGAELVDEVWAPSRFVAELYAGAARKQVKLVKKPRAAAPGRAVPVPDVVRFPLGRRAQEPLRRGARLPGCVPAPGRGRGADDQDDRIRSRPLGRRQQPVAAHPGGRGAGPAHPHHRRRHAGEGVLRPHPRPRLHGVEPPGRGLRLPPGLCAGLPARRDRDGLLRLDRLLLG